MNTVIFGLLCGVVAGIIDVVPMLMQKLPWNANLSAFIQWVFLGLVIANCNIGLPGWATGLLLGLLAAAPIILITAIPNIKTAIPIVCMSAIIGTALGIVTRSLLFLRG